MAETTDKTLAPTMPVSAPVPARSGMSYRRRILVTLLVLCGIVLLWYGSGYVFTYTDDAYLTSDLLSVAPQVTGPVVSVSVQDDEAVPAGAPLFAIDPQPFQYELDRSTAEMAQAQAQLPIDRALLRSATDARASALAQLQLDTANQDRNIALEHEGFASEQALQETQTQERRSAERLRAAQSGVDQAQQRLEVDQIAVGAAQASRLLAAWRLGRTKVIAPLAGRIAHFTLRVGDMAVASTPLVALIADQEWRVIANFKESVVRHLRPGAIAWVWLDTHPWRLYRARIRGVAPGIRRDQDPPGLLPYVSPTIDWIRLERRLPVRLILDHPPPRDALFMGSDARVFVWY
jgi:multidrug resistance efflux pump